MSKVATIIEHAEHQCKANSTRLTDRRKQILSGLLQSGKALSAYELVEYCKSEFDENVPAMSVYRILSFLEDQHLVHRLKLANKYVACSHIVCDHAHEVTQFLICRDCQQVKEINVSKNTIEQLHNSIKEVGFKLLSPQIEMNCLCDQCVSCAA